MRAAFARPGFGRLYAGLTTSMLGDSIMLLVLSMWVKTLTGSNAQAGLTFFFMVIPALFAPLLGVWIDRLRRKPLLVWGNLASAVAVLPLVLVRDAGDVWLVWAVAFLYGVSFVVLPAALNGLLKELMPDDLLVDANASLQTTKEAFRLFGPLVGAALFAWTGGWLVAVIDAVSFLVAALVIATIRLREEPPQRDESHLLVQMVAGLRHLGGDRVLRHVLVGFGMTMLVLGFSEASIYSLLDAFDKPATYAGVFVTVQGVGAVAGGLVSSRLIRRVGEVGATVIGLALMAGSIAGCAAAPTMPVVLAFAVPFGVSLPMLFIAFTTLVQRRSPQAIMGRVSTAVEVLLASPQAASLAVGSLLVALLSYRTIFWIMAVVIAAGAGHIAFWLRRQIGSDWRSVDQRLYAVAEDLLGEDGRTGDPDPVEYVVGRDAPALGALGADGHLAAGED
jgi:MFS family permease